MMELIITYYVIVNLFSCFLMGLDKRKAALGQRRIKERTFFLLCWMLGSMGALFGMYIFRHKTKHCSFKYGIPIIFLINIITMISIMHLMPQFS